MILDDQDLRMGMKFIVGTWRADYVVNAFSDDLSHIPAAEFKSQDGRDLGALRFVFSEDHSLRIDAGAETYGGTWEQTDLGEYRFAPDELEKYADSDFVKAVETLSVSGDGLVFSLGFLAIGLKKTEEGHITEKPDIGDIEPSAEDLAARGVVGTYRVAKTMAAVDGDFGLFTRDEVLASLNKRADAGEIERDEIDEELRAFDTRIEFTDDHRVLTWSPLPKGVSEKDIEEALASGEIGAVKDGFFCAEEKEWKSVGGKYYYDTGAHRELFGEVKSPWDELTVDGDGYTDFGSGMMKLEKI